MPHEPLDPVNAAWSRLMGTPAERHVVFAHATAFSGELSGVDALGRGIKGGEPHFFWQQGAAWFLSTGLVWQGAWEAPKVTVVLGGEGTGEAVRFVGGRGFYPEGWQSSKVWAQWPQSALWMGDTLWMQEGEGEGVVGVWTTLIEPGSMTKEAFATLFHTKQAALQTQWERAAATCESVKDEAPRGAESSLPQSKKFWTALLADATVQLSGEYALLEKVVLARSLEHRHAPAAGMVPSVMRHLDKKFGASCTLFCLKPPGAPRRHLGFLGATPECLVRRDAQGQIQVDALAGSAPPGLPDAALLGDPKERHEHQVVVDAIVKALGPVATLSVPGEPVVDRLANVSHLRTPISGHVLATIDLFDLVDRLHPTPAVCGAPKALAMHWLAEREQLERGWYAGGVGWVGPGGAGEVAVALRCGLLEQDKVTLFVGAGVVAASDPQKEWEETALKAQALGDFWGPA